MEIKEIELKSGHILNVKVIPEDKTFDSKTGELIESIPQRLSIGYYNEENYRDSFSFIVNFVENETEEELINRIKPEIVKELEWSISFYKEQVREYEQMIERYESFLSENELV